MNNRERHKFKFFMVVLLPISSEVINW